MRYLTAQICLNGHMVTSSTEQNPELMQDYCSKCGAKTITSCPSCGAPLRGELYDDGIAIVGFRPSVDSYCVKCGTPYPWTEKILNNAVEIIALADDLDDFTKDLIKTAIPDLLVDSPSTPLAAAKYQKGVSKAGQLVRDSLYNLLIDVVSSTAKKILFT